MVQAWLQSVAVSPSPPTGRFSADSLLRQIVLLPVHQSTTLISGYKDKLHLILKACKWWKRSLQKERRWSQLGSLLIEQMLEMPCWEPVCSIGITSSEWDCVVWSQLNPSISDLSLILAPASKRRVSHTTQLPICLLRFLLQQKGGSRADPSAFLLCHIHVPLVNMAVASPN